jgi:hypothetical protein
MLKWEWSLDKDPTLEEAPGFVSISIVEILERSVECFID